MRRSWLDLVVGAIVLLWVGEVSGADSTGVISLPSSQSFEGADGKWSTFAFQIGADKKSVVHLLPATSMVETYVISTDGCSEALNWTGGYKACEETRGGVVDLERSSWIATTANALDNMAIMKRYNITGMAGKFGYDTVTPGYVSGGGIPVAHSIVAGMVDIKVFLMGQFGLRPEPTNFTDNTGMNSPQMSFMEKLKRQKTIASLSYGYTAGAYYQKSPGVFGSLTMGGYDKNRRIGKEALFPMYDDIETPLMVSLNSLTISNTADASSNLLSQSDSGFNSSTIDKPGPIPIRIDSSRPFIYLPPWTCDAIAKILGLQLQEEPGDAETAYYFLTDKTAAKLSASNISMTFMINSIGDHTKDSSIRISLPYSALIQTLSYPLNEQARPYIPIRRATNPNQYVLGRTFLQEAYLTADYERRTFSLHQAAFPYPATEMLIALKPPFRLSKAIIGAIAAGAGGLIILLLIALFFLHRIKQRRYREAAEAEEEAARIKGLELEISFPTSPSSPSDVAMKIMEIDSETVHEIGGMPRQHVQEMGVPMTPVHGEMPDESTLSSYGGFFKEVASEQHGHPIIKVFYEMDGTPPGSEQGTPTGTLSSAGTTLIGSPSWSASGGSQTSTQGSTLSPLRNHRRVDSDGLSPIPQTPAEFYERRPAEFFHRMNDQRAGPSSHIGDMSPIPQTPLEYYGTAALPGGSGNRGWIGRAPPDMPVTKAPLKSKKSEEKVKMGMGDVEVPRVVLVPATPSEISEKERERRRWLRGDSQREGEGSGIAKGKMKMNEVG